MQIPLHNKSLLIEDPINLYYFLGFKCSKGTLLLEEGRKELLVDLRYTEAAKKAGLTVVEKIVPRFPVCFDPATTTYRRYEELKALYPDLSPVSLDALRSIKRLDEVEILQRAADLTRRGIEEMKRHLAVGVTEEEIAYLFEAFCRTHGASALSFSPIVAFGANSAYPHHRAGKTKLESNSIVLLDVGAVVDEYHADLTETCFFGKPDERLYGMWELVKRVQSQVMKEVRPGVTPHFLYEMAKEALGARFTHSLGHGVGLETHEYPLLRQSKSPLEPGMALAIEPALYEVGLGGVRLEKMVVVTERGYVEL